MKWLKELCKKSTKTGGLDPLDYKFIFPLEILRHSPEGKVTQIFINSRKQLEKELGGVSGEMQYLSCDADYHLLRSKGAGIGPFPSHVFKIVILESNDGQANQI